MKSALPPPPKSYRRNHRLLGPTLHMLQLSCGQIADLHLQSMDRPLTLGEKIRHGVHYLICPLCRKFEKQMRAFSWLVKSSFSGREPQMPDPGFISSLRSKLESMDGGSNR